MFNSRFNGGARARRIILALIAVIGAGARAQVDAISPRQYTRYAFTPDVPIDQNLTVDRLDAFVALHVPHAPQFLRALPRDAGGIQSGEVLILKYFMPADYPDIVDATKRQVAQLAEAIHQPVPSVQAPIFPNEARLAISWINNFEGTARALMRGEPVHFQNAEYTIAMLADKYRNPSDNFPIRVYVRQIDWDSTAAQPMRVAQQLISGRAVRAPLDADDLRFVGNLLKLHLCEAALN